MLLLLLLGLVPLLVMVLAKLPAMLLRLLLLHQRLVHFEVGAGTCPVQPASSECASWESSYEQRPSEPPPDQPTSHQVMMLVLSVHDASSQS